MTIRKMIVVDVSLVGSFAKRTIAFPVAFSRKRTNRVELLEIVRLQLRQELGSDLYGDVSNAVVYLSSEIGCVKLCSFSRKVRVAA